MLQRWRRDNWIERRRGIRAPLRRRSDFRSSGSDNKEGDEKKDEAADAAKDKTAEAGKSDADKTDKSGSSTSRQRYIMVMAQFNPELITKPALEPVPESKPAADKATDASAAKSDSGKSDTKSADSKAGAAKSANKADAKSSTDTKKSGDASKKGDDAKTNEKKSDEKKADDKKSDDKAADEKKADQPAEEDPDVKEAERERIEKQNRVKQDEYNDKVKQGQDRVKDLNARFADWYYVVSDETYRKMHLGEDQIIKKKTPEKTEGTTPPANPFPPVKSARRIRRRSKELHPEISNPLLVPRQSRGAKTVAFQCVSVAGVFFGTLSQFGLLHFLSQVGKLRGRRADAALGVCHNRPPIFAKCPNVNVIVPCGAHRRS